MGRLFVTRCQLTRKRVITAVLGLCSLVFVFIAFPRSTFQDVRFFDFKPTPEKPQEAPEPAPRFYRTVEGRDIFLYSAIANDREPSDGEVNIIITAFDSTATDSLQCCVLTEGDKLYTTQASVFYKFYIEDVLSPVLELFKNAPTKAKQYACVLPQLGFQASHVTLSSSSSCPTVLEEYLPVLRPEVVPGGLALCAKAAFGDELDPNKLMEWFEVQRLLGVDHIQLMDLNNPEPVQKVFRYYKDMGLLNPLPYELPGPPYNRGLDQPHWVAQQASHDETFPILDCKQRLRGYTYVMGHDMDEVLMPAKHQSIKELLKEQLMRRPDAAGFYFFTQFFVYDWGPENTNTDIMMLRYLNSTEPRNECKKYIYLSNRVVQARTHRFFTRSSYEEYWVPKEDAILHHYRKCPAHVWSTCNPKRITDSSMVRFQKELVERLELVRQATGIRPTAS